MKNTNQEMANAIVEKVKEINNMVAAARQAGLYVHIKPPMFNRQEALEVIITQPNELARHTPKPDTTTENIWDKF